jgi:hypothetical protein
MSRLYRQPGSTAGADLVPSRRRLEEVRPNKSGRFLRKRLVRLPVAYSNLFPSVQTTGDRHHRCFSVYLFSGGSLAMFVI